MEEPVVRGYIVQQMVDFIQKYYDEETRKQIYAPMSSDTRAQLAALESAVWYPRDHVVTLLRGIVAVKNDEVESYNDLLEVGRFVAVEATNTFLKLLLRMLTPALFFKKQPSFWARDTRGCGRYEVDLSRIDANEVRMKLIGAQGYDHVCITGLGFLESALTSMGKKGLRIKQSGWSLATPSPPEVNFEIAWN